MNDIQVRPLTPNDYAYVKSTWLKHYKDHSEFAKPIRKSVFFEWHPKIVDAILSRKLTQVLIATHANEPEVIMGFLVFEHREAEPVIHYAYVIEKARRMGIGRELINAAWIKLPFSYSHRTRDAKTVASRWSEITYNPYLI